MTGKETYNMSKQKEAVFITKWKGEMKRRLKLRFPDKKLSEKKVERYLDSCIHAYMVNPKVEVVNNYRNKKVETDLLSLIDTIEDQDLIIGGNAVLYVQHDTDSRPNYMYQYIVSKQGLRNSYKAQRKPHEKASRLWTYYDNLQNATKIIINGLYGIHGYAGFILYNRFLAESITNMGRQIITTAVMSFENFLSGSIKYNTEEEIYQYITNIVNEYDPKLDYGLFEVKNIKNKIFDKIMNLCAFNPSQSFIRHVKEMIDHLNYGELILLYYKNNLYDFSKVPFIYEKLKYITSNLDELKEPSYDKIKDPVIVDMIHEVWAFYETFVLYDYPIHDRVRKAMFTDRNNVLYVDTDSNFLGLNEWVNFIKQDVLDNKYTQPEKEMDFISVNLAALFLAEVIDRGLHTLCKHMGTHKEHADRLKMKNEFYLSRMMFVENTKKRYISISILQEGDLIRDGLGMIDIKGFDFKKSVTKEHIRNIYSDICENDILRADKIDVEGIYLKVLKLKKEIEDSLKAGESQFFKQANVNIIEHYKKPWSVQGIKGVYLWNALCPDYQMELPTDCDIVPIHDISGPKYDANRKRHIWTNERFVAEFQEKFPDAFDRLESEIYSNGDQQIREMDLNCLAKPKNEEIPIPNWFSFILDYEKVVMDDLNLISPILNSLGLHVLKTNSKSEYITNIIDL